MQLATSAAEYEYDAEHLITRVPDDTVQYKI